MKMQVKFLSLSVFVMSTMMISCKKDDVTSPESSSQSTISIENVLDSKPLVESGTYSGPGTPPVIFPGQSVSFSFYASKAESITFASMYGWSNDLFFAPANPGITLYNADGTPVTGDVSSQIKLWDNGTRVNQAPGSAVMHPGVAEATVKNVKEVSGTDDYGNTYLAASKLMNVSLKYNGNSNFTITITNNSGGTANETPFSPGVWAISYVAGGKQLLANALYTSGQVSANGLTSLAETGNGSTLSTYLTGLTGTFTPLSPVMVVVYSGATNPFYKTGELDRGQGLKNLAQKGSADSLASVLRLKAGVKSVYILKDMTNTVLLPKINGAAGGKVSQVFSYSPGDRIAITTMYGFSNDWFFATTGNDIDASMKGDFSSSIALLDNGTAVSQYPGAGVTQFNLAGTPLSASMPISIVPNPNAFTTLPAISNMIKVSIQ